MCFLPILGVDSLILLLRISYWIFVHMEMKRNKFVAIGVFSYIFLSYFMPQYFIIDPLNEILGFIFATDYIADGFSPGRLVYWSLFWPFPIMLMVYFLLIFYLFKKKRL